MFFPMNGKFIIGRCNLQMKLATIIREADLEVSKFLKASQLSLALLDENWDEILDPDIHFHEPIFANNPKSKELFEQFLCKLEANLSEEPNSFPCIDMRLSEQTLLVRVAHPLFFISFFSRQPEC